MGVVFLETMNDEAAANPTTKQYICRNCKTYLTDDTHLISTDFQSSNGAAYLFSKVVNITFGKAERRNMMTGYHYVRDINCKSCNKKLGWMYEFAYEKRQQYKEGKLILETAGFLSCRINS